MTARVLVVDDILANVKLLQARLQAEYFEVIPAFSGQEALDICQQERVDVILLDVMMPGMDGFEACRRIKADPATQDVPVIMVTALDQPSDKLQGLEAGADDFLSKPVDEIALITRVKNLARLKMLNDEMSMRASTTSDLGLPARVGSISRRRAESGRILVVDDHVRSSARLVEALAKHHDAFVERTVPMAIDMLTKHKFDLLIASLSLKDADGLRLCGQIRSIDKLRHLPIIILVEPGDEARLMRGLDMGVNDYLMRPIDRNEMLARVRTQIKRKRYSDFLRNRLEESVELAITDSLTGLYNRRYMEAHLRSLVDEAKVKGRNLTVLIADIDHFKRINDTYGHDAGDLVLKDFAHRLQQNMRGIDLTCRIGGEEFVILMPDTDLELAGQIAERLRAQIAQVPFSIDRMTTIDVTASVGLASFDTAADTPEVLLKRADKALYAAKRGGRNRVVFAEIAA
jgi:two-component system, cell cycle response regulator